MNQIYETLLLLAQAHAKKPVENIDEIIDEAREIRAKALGYYQSEMMTEDQYKSIIRALTGSA